MGGNNSRVRITRYLRRPERDRSDTEEEDEEGLSVQPVEDDSSGDDSFDNSGDVQNMLRYLLRYRLQSRSLQLHA